MNSRVILLHSNGNKHEEKGSEEDNKWKKKQKKTRQDGGVSCSGHAWFVTWFHANRSATCSQLLHVAATQTLCYHLVVPLVSFFFFNFYFLVSSFYTPLLQRKYIIYKSSLKKSKDELNWDQRVVVCFLFL